MSQVLVDDTRLLPWVFAVGWTASAILLGRIVLDLPALNMALAILAGIWFVAIGALGVGHVAGAFRVAATRESSALSRHAGLVWVIPIATVASKLDCTGPTLYACGPVCFVLMYLVTPILAYLCYVYFRKGYAKIFFYLVLVEMLYLVPNCTCYNPLNSWWIDRLGLSPACFSLGFTASLVAVSCLFTGKLQRLSLFASWGLVGVMVAIFVDHNFLFLIY